MVTLVSETSLLWISLLLLRLVVAWTISFRLLGVLVAVRVLAFSVTSCLWSFLLWTWCEMPMLGVFGAVTLARLWNSMCRAMGTVPLLLVMLSIRMTRSRFLDRLWVLCRNLCLFLGRCRKMFFRFPISWLMIVW